MTVRKLEAPDYLAEFDGSRLTVRPRPKWLTTVGLIIIAVLMLGAGIYSLASGIGGKGGAWAGLGIALGCGGLVVVRLHRAKNEFFSLDLVQGGASLEFYYLARDERHAPLDTLSVAAGTFGEVEVDISKAPGSRTVDGIWTSVRIYLHTGDPERPRRFMYAVSTVDRRAEALRVFIEDALRDLAVSTR